jgi:hypothetical protein
VPHDVSLSVAQYLPANQALFDVVICDEASQITVWDAVGSLARGRQIIVAGDPKQMPPTNFFASSDDPGGEGDVKGDLESILDELRIAFDYKGEVTAQDAEDILGKIRALPCKALKVAEGPARAGGLAVRGETRTRQRCRIDTQREHIPGLQGL